MYLRLDFFRTPAAFPIKNDNGKCCKINILHHLVSMPATHLCSTCKDYGLLAHLFRHSLYPYSSICNTHLVGSTYVIASRLLGYHYRSFIFEYKLPSPDTSLLHLFFLPCWIFQSIIISLRLDGRKFSRCAHTFLTRFELLILYTSLASFRLEN